MWAPMSTASFCVRAHAGAAARACGSCATRGRPKTARFIGELCLGLAVRPLAGLAGAADVARDAVPRVRCRRRHSGIADYRRGVQ